jgi:hypothetical protein
VKAWKHQPIGLRFFIKKETRLLGAKTDTAEFIGYENGCLTLGFPANLHIL